MASRPRLLILSAYYFPFQGGTETHARRVAREMAARGFAVTIVTKRDDRGSADDETIDGITVHRVPPKGPRGGVRKMAMLPFAMRAMTRRRDEWDLVYCPGYQGIGLAALSVGHRLRRPVVLRSGNLGVLAGWQWDAPLRRWGLSPSLWPIPALKAALRRRYMRADMLVCNSRDNEREAAQFGMPLTRTIYLPNAVDVARFRPANAADRPALRAALGWPPDDRVLLYVGRLSAEKGVIELLEAWQTVRQPNWRLVLVGPDMPGHPLDRGPQARALAQSLGIADRVTFHGEAVDTAPLLRAADAYVQPSHYESFSNALVEAMATGLPIVATRVGGMLDCIVDGVNGVLCTPNDAASLAAALTAVLSDDARAAALGRHARVTVERDFDERAIFDRFAEMFDEVSRAYRTRRDANARA